MLKVRLFPILILFLGLGVTFIISYSAFQDINQLYKQEFETACQELENKIQIQLKANAQILYSSAAFISSSDSITREEWKEFQYLNKSHRELPGIRGVGYSAVIPKHQVSRFEQQICREGYSEFKVWPAGDRDIYTSVVYIEPSSVTNSYGLGYDAYTEPVRRKAMDWARDHDQATISDKVILVQDSVDTEQIGAIMFVPVFKSGLPKETVDERKTALLGWVYSPFGMDDLLKSTLGQWDYQAIRLKIFDDQAMVSEELLFDSDLALSVQHSGEPGLIYNIPLDFNDKLWVLNFGRYTTSHQLPARIRVILINGVVFSLLLFILVISLINARTRSVQIQVLNEELRKVNVNKDRFISVLAHDLKSPFNSLLGFSELLAEHFNEFEKKEAEYYANRLYAAAKFTYSLLEELLLWARLQSDQFPFSPEKLNLNELCRNLVGDYTLIAGEKNITLSFDEGNELFVKADEFMLKTILRNLLINAIKFTHEGGAIHLSISSESTKVIVAVSDSGIGMSPEEISKLFDISMVHSKLGTANEKGTGLGLMLCRDMLARHGGEIWVESTVGAGSVFRFSIPVAAV